MFKKEEPIISFVSTVPGLDKIEDVRPKPSREFLPSWWKDTPKQDSETNALTVRSCPALVDYFNDGYIIPMWADTMIKYNETTNVWNVEVGTRGDAYGWEIHYNEQAIKHAKFSTFGQVSTFIFKAISPWKVITRKGWSVYQKPLYYHFNNDFSVLPGTIDTDIHHEINQQVMYFGDNKEIFIKQGQPFVQYVPFERKKISSDIRYQTEDDILKFKTLDLQYDSAFANPVKGVYRKLQRLRDR